MQTANYDENVVRFLDHSMYIVLSRTRANWWFLSLITSWEKPSLKRFSQGVCTQLPVAEYKMFPATNDCIVEIGVHVSKGLEFFLPAELELTRRPMSYSTRARIATIDLLFQVGRVTESQFFFSRFGLLLTRWIEEIIINSGDRFHSAVPCTDSSKRNLGYLTLIRKKISWTIHHDPWHCRQKESVFIIFVLRGRQHAKQKERGAWHTSV